MTNYLPKMIIFLSAIYHLIAGIFVLGPKKWTIYFSKNTYRLKIPNQYEPRYEVTLRFLGLMAIALSAHLFLILYVQNNILISYSLFILSLLFISRATLRIILRKNIFDAYELTFKQSLINIVFNLTIGFVSLISIYFVQ